MNQCRTWESICHLRQELSRIVELFASYSHPRVLACSVELDTRLNECRRCLDFPCSLVQRHQETTQFPLNPLVNGLRNLLD